MMGKTTITANRTTNTTTRRRRKNKRSNCRCNVCFQENNTNSTTTTLLTTISGSSDGLSANDIIVGTRSKATNAVFYDVLKGKFSVYASAKAKKLRNKAIQKIIDEMMMEEGLRFLEPLTVDDQEQDASAPPRYKLACRRQVHSKVQHAFRYLENKERNKKNKISSPPPRPPPRFTATKNSNNPIQDNDDRPPRPTNGTTKPSADDDANRFLDHEDGSSEPCWLEHGTVCLSDLALDELSAVDESNWEDISNWLDL